MELENRKTIADNRHQYSERDRIIDNEISLTEIWRIILRQRKVMGGTWILAVLLAFGYLGVAEPVYDSKALVRVGQIGLDFEVSQKVLIENLDALVQRLEAQNRVSSGERNYPRISVKKESQDIIAISVKGPTKLGVKDDLEGVVKKLTSDHEIIYNNTVTVQREWYESLKTQITTIETQVKNLFVLIEGLKDKNLSEASLLTSQFLRVQLLMKIPELKKTAAMLQLALTEPWSRQTQPIGEIIVFENSIKPDPEKVIASGILLGFLLGILSVFVVENYNKAKPNNDGSRSSQAA